MRLRGEGGGGNE
uniref:Uncharacterized protein n=1 Tax=Arundo donax TaxID=35708 RepID=A0A0A9FCR9_ARUDO